MRFRRAGLLALALAAAASAAIAADAPPRAAAVESLLKCRDLADGAARLACYDAAAGRIGEAEKSGDIVVIDRAQAAAAHREAFGLHLPSLDFVDKALKPGETEQVDGVVRALSADASGRWTLSLEGGAVWRQIDGVLFRPPHPGSKVHIRRGSLGSYLMNIDGQPAVKVHRDR